MANDSGKDQPGDPKCVQKASVMLDWGLGDQQRNFSRDKVNDISQYILN